MKVHGNLQHGKRLGSLYASLHESSSASLILSLNASVAEMQSGRMKGGVVVIVDDVCMAMRGFGGETLLLFAVMVV